MAEYWYNLYTKQVEEGAKDDYRQLIGPYATREEAAHALERAAQNTKRWDDEDAAFNGD
ncbi:MULTISPECIES: SPOR domain-containing protein [Kocuria]|uniref:SPOR domain-containing protein n=1 Tax=Kocuria TaxID=57493 RepID=UPI0011A8422C|nr:MULTISPECIES: SPOR domain-containing protein [Kocuria]